MTLPALSAEQIDALREVANIGAGHAADALSRMTGRTIRLAVPRVSSLPVADVPRALGGAETPVTALTMPVTGDARGNIALVLSPWSTRSLLDQLLDPRRESTASSEMEEFDPEECSALFEAASILCGAYMSAVGRLLNRKLLPAPPGLAADMAGAVAEHLIADLSEVSDTALVLEAELSGDSAGPAGRIFFLPHPVSLDRLVLPLRVTGPAE